MQAIPDEKMIAFPNDHFKTFQVSGSNGRPLPPPDGSFGPVGDRNSKVIGSDVCHRGCAHTVLLTVQRAEVYSAVYGTVHYKEPLK